MSFFRRLLIIPALIACFAIPMIFTRDKGDENPLTRLLGSSTTNSESGVDQSNVSNAIGEFQQFVPSVSDVGSASSDSNYSEAAPQVTSQHTVVSYAKTNGQTATQSTQTFDKQSPAYAPMVFDFREVFRFDVNPEWLKQNWQRVSVVKSLDGLTGYRVALVTGPNRDDLTGSMTYFFNHLGGVERLIFTGTSWEKERIVYVAQNYFQLRPDPQLGAGFLTARHRNELKSVFKIEAPWTIYADPKKQKQFKINFELNNARGQYRLSPEMTSFVFPAPNQK